MQDQEPEQQVVETKLLWYGLELLWYDLPVPEVMRIRYPKYNVPNSGQIIQIQECIGAAYILS